MRRFLFTVEDVFQIRGLGCIVVPGIPREFEAPIKFGEPLWLTHPDGSERMTTIRPLIVSSSPNHQATPILLGAEISKADVTIGTRISVEFTPANAFTLIARNDTHPLRLETFFQQEDSGHLGFGWSARTLFPATVSDILREPLEFRDYLMEGFVTYHLYAGVADETLTLTASLHGTNRDRYLPGHFAFHLRQAGFDTVP